jgi:hypothetical protein
MQNQSPKSDTSEASVEQDEDYFERSGLLKLELEHKPIFDFFLSANQPPLSDATFANIFMWGEVYNTRWKIVRDCLCVFLMEGGEPSMMFPPIGFGDKEAALEECLFFFKEFNSQSLRLECVPQEWVDKLGLFDLEVRSGDYVYETQRMIDLKGAALASKRQSRAAFMRRYSNIYTERFTSAHIEECLKLLDIWQPQVRESVTIDLKRSQETASTKRVLQNAEALGLIGMVLYASDQVVGFTFGEKLGTDIFSILIEKTDRNLTGSAQYIFSEFCRLYWAAIKWCNVGDDWEIPSLAWSKESYRPAFRIPKWSANFYYGKGAQMNGACSRL